MRRPPLSPIVILLAAAASLTACTDPYSRPGTWHATGVNQDNLLAMLADPDDAAWGVTQIGSNGQLAAAAVTRLRAGQVKTLPNDSISKIGGGGSVGGGAAQNPGTTPSAGGSN